MKSRKSRLGQATTLAVLGLVIVSLVTGAIFIRTAFKAPKYEKEIEKAEILPESIQKVKLYADSCLRETLEEAVNIVGLQGGYITIQKDPIPLSPANPLSNYFDMFGDGTLRIPYWFYESANGVPKTEVPTLASMEKQISDYINDNVELCLNNFAPFTNRGYEISIESERSTKIIISDEKVTAELDLPVTIFTESGSFSLDKYTISTDNYLGKLYQRAREIFEAENENYFFEEKTMDMFVVYDELPLSGVDFECTPKTWLKTEVGQNLRRILSLNIPQIKVDGTTFTQKKELDEYFTVEAIDGKESMEVNFIYRENWPLLMDVLGEGEVLSGKPFTMGNAASRFLLPFFCLNDYHFVYNLKYPVVVALKKGNTLFQFASQVVINHNQPRENRAEPTALDIESPICQYPTQELEVIAESQREDGTYMQLNDARISLKCMNMQCEIGRTSPSTGVSSIKAKFPACFNAQIIAEKDGFHPGKVIVSTNEPPDRTITVTLEPYYDLEVDVRVDDEGTIRAPYPSEEIYFELENKEKEFAANLIYPGQQRIKLIPGEYEVRSTMVVQSTSGFTIEPKKVRVCTDKPRSGVMGVIGLTERVCQTHEIEGTKLDQIVGGTGSTTWYAHRAILGSSEKLILYGVRGKTPASFEELEKAASFGTEIIKPLREPELS